MSGGHYGFPGLYPTEYSSISQGTEEVGGRWEAGETAGETAEEDRLYKQNKSVFPQRQNSVKLIPLNPFHCLMLSNTPHGDYHQSPGSEKKMIIWCWSQEILWSKCSLVAADEPVLTR